VEIGEERYAVPQSVVREIVRVEADRVTRMESNELLNYRDNVLPLIHFANETQSQALLGGTVHALIIGEGTQANALAIDRVLGLREIVVRPLTDRLVQVPELTGATELGDGRVVLILNTSSIATNKRRLLGDSQQSRSLSPENVHGL
jgi:two-component system chemotaxis sensor kinase CheA